SLLLSERGESHMGCPTPPWEHIGAEVATEMINPAGVEELLFPCNPATQPCEVIRTVVLPTIGGQAPVLSPTQGIRRRVEMGKRAGPKIPVRVEQRRIRPDVCTVEPNSERHLPHQPHTPCLGMSLHLTPL